MNKFDTLLEAVVNNVDIPGEIAHWITNVLMLRLTRGPSQRLLKQPQNYNQQELEYIKNVIYPKYKHLSVLTKADRDKIYKSLWYINPVNKQRMKNISKKSYLKTQSILNKGLQDIEAKTKYIQIMIFKAKERASNPKSPKEFNITVQDVLNVWPKDNLCPIFKVPLVKGIKRSAPNSPSLDRINSSKGYVPGNIVVMSYLANELKNDATADELDKIADYIEGKI